MPKLFKLKSLLEKEDIIPHQFFKEAQKMHKKTYHPNVYNHINCRRGCNYETGLIYAQALSRLAGKIYTFNDLL